MEQFGVAIQHFDQLDQCQRRLGLAVFAAGESISIWLSIGPDGGVALFLGGIA
jgi:hypothetical protein